jgi:hypothetical protein
MGERWVWSDDIKTQSKTTQRTLMSIACEVGCIEERALSDSLL